MGLPAACRSWLAAASTAGTSKTLFATAAGRALTASPPLAATPTKALFLPTRRHSTTTTTTEEHPQTAPTADGPAPPPTSPWVILGSIPRVVQGSNAGGGDAADVSLALAAPPRVSRLSVSSRVFPDRPTPQNFPFVLAADGGSGLLLLSAILAAPLTRVESADRKSLCWRDSDPRYFILDAATGSALRLPDPGPEQTILHQALVGVLACPGGGGRYVVSELLPVAKLERNQGRR